MATPLAVDVGGGVAVLSNSVANVDSSSNVCLKSSSAKKEEEEKRRSPILIFLFFHKAIRKELDGLHRLAMAFATGKQTDIRPLLELGEGGELRRESEVEDVVGKVEESEPREGGDLGRNGTRERVGGKSEIGEIEAEVGDVEGESAGEIETGEVEGGHVAVRVARDAGPCAVGGVGGPGGEGGVWVEEGGFEREEGAVGGDWTGGGESVAEEEEEPHFCY